jgi:hypothetical protein
MNYDYLSGTSMACPHVSGLAALLLALNPSYTYTELRTRILSTVETLLSLTGKVLMGGRINAWSALTTTDVSMHLNTIEPAADFAMYGGVPYNVTAWVHNVTDPILAASVQASFSTGEPNITLKDDGVAPDRFANDGIYTAYWTPSVAGNLTIAVSASAGGYAPASRSVSGRVKSIPSYTITETAYQWVELSGQVVGLCLGDDSSLTVTSPFPISFYGDLYTNLTVGSNGNINFENKYSGLVNYPIPSANGYSVDRLIGVLWTDLDMRTYIDHGTVLCGIVGTSPNRTLVIEWKDVAHYYDTGSVTFEVLFYENSSDIVLQYQDVSFEYSYYDYGADATVGIQYNPEWGTQYSYDTPSLHDSLALRLSSVQLSLQFLVSAIMNDPVQTVYYVRTGNIYDDSALGFVYGKSSYSQNIIPQSNATYVNQTSGMPLVSGDLVVFGGRLASKVTKYYEDNNISKIGYSYNSTHILFVELATGRTVYAVPYAGYNPSAKDYFVVQAFKDGSRTVLDQWGVSAYGTYASGICFADLVWPHIADFGGSYYVYCWEDLNSDGMQTANEISLKASGT